MTPAVPHHLGEKRSWNRTGRWSPQGAFGFNASALTAKLWASGDKELVGTSYSPEGQKVVAEMRAALLARTGAYSNLRTDEQVVRVYTSFIRTSMRDEARPVGRLLSRAGSGLGFDISRIPDIGRIPDSIEAAIRDILYPRPSQPIDRPQPHIALCAVFEQQWCHLGYTRGESHHCSGARRGDDPGSSFLGQGNREIRTPACCRERDHTAELTDAPAVRRLGDSIYDPPERFSARQQAQISSIGFDDFWRAYPKKVDRGQALRAVAKARENASCQYIVDILDDDLEMASIAGDGGREGFPDRPIAELHIGNQRVSPSTPCSTANAQAAAQRNKLRIGFDVGDKAKHLACGMVDPVLSLKRMHCSPHHELRAEHAQARYLSTFGSHGPYARLRCGPSSARNPRARDMKSGSKATTEQGAIL